MAATTPNNNTMSLKLLIDTKVQKVLFAEAPKEFVDFLLFLLSLPVATVIKLVTKESMLGCIANLYESFRILNESYIQPNQVKDSLLNPKMSHTTTLLISLLPHDDVVPSKQKLYRCCSNPSPFSSHYCSQNFVTDNPSNLCSSCNNIMSTELQFVSTTTNANSTPANNPGSTSSTDEGGYVKGLVSYMVTDDLSVSPMSMISGVGMMNKFNVKDFGCLQEKVVHVEMDHGMKLLKASLLSKTVLTNVFLAKSN